MNSATKVVKNVGKKGMNIITGAAEFSTAALQGQIAQGIIILLLIIYSGIVIQYLPLSFLSFFENIIVKVVVLIIIAFVGLFSPSVALFIAIALIVTLQQAQRKRLISDSPQENMNNMDHQKMKDLKKKAQHKMQEMADGEIMESMQGYLDPTMMGSGRNYSNLDYQEGTVPGQQNNSPQGFNENSSCIGSCGGNNGNPSISSMCGEVKTWNNQMSAQGLGGVGEQPGFSPSVGFPV